MNFLCQTNTYYNILKVNIKLNLKYKIRILEIKIKIIKLLIKVMIKYLKFSKIKTHNLSYTIRIKVIFKNPSVFCKINEIN